VVAATVEGRLEDRGRRGWPAGHLVERRFGADAGRSGELDRSAPPANGEALRAANPHHVELHTLPGAVHALPIDRPVQCAEIVTDWLERRP